MNTPLTQRHSFRRDLYFNPTRRLFGPGCFARLPEVLDAFAPRELLLVLGGKSFRESPYFQTLEQMLTSCGAVRTVIVSRSPTQEFLQTESDRLRSCLPDLVVAVGGGSVLDAAKLLAAIPRQPQTELQCMLEKMPLTMEESAPLVAIPTTAGTGSEVTPYASLDIAGPKKITLEHPNFYPAVALVDPCLSGTLPRHVTAATGFDALCQAIESFWAVAATPFSRTHALRALGLIRESFLTVCQEPFCPQARAGMALASTEAGLAIAQTRTTAVHSASYPISAHFQIIHGHACALTLASFIRFNAPALGDAGRPLLEALRVPDYEALAAMMEQWMDTVGLQRSLSALGIEADGRALILRDGFRPDRMNNNPRKVEKEDLKKILETIR